MELKSSLMITFVLFTNSLSVTNVSNSDLSVIAAGSELGEGISKKPEVDDKLESRAETNSTESLALSTEPTPTQMQQQKKRGSILREKAALQNLTDADKRVRADWGGYCIESDWDKCMRQKKLAGKYIDEEGNLRYANNRSINCKFLPTWCMKNGWTVTDCQLICMAQCSEDLLTNFDKYVSGPGECQFPT